MARGRPPRLVTSLIQDQLTNKKYRILKKDLKCKTLKKEARALRNIFKKFYIFPAVKSALLLLFYILTSLMLERIS